MNRDDLQRITLHLLGTSGDARLGRGQNHLAERIKNEVAPEDVNYSQIQEIYWALISQGLAYIDMWQPAPENWSLRLTPAGLAAVQDEEYNPNDPSGFLARLIEDVPGIGDLVRKYATEALHAYNSQLYLASSVMQGVASEAAFLELGRSFGAWLDGKERENFLSTFNSRKQNYLAKFSAFRKRIGSHKGQLPPELSDGLDLWLNSVLDLLRIYRNEVGHPTGRVVDRDDCFVNLRMLARYLRKMYLLRDFFENNT